MTGELPEPQPYESWFRQTTHSTLRRLNSRHLTHLFAGQPCYSCTGTQWPFAVIFAGPCDARVTVHDPA